MYILLSIYFSFYFSYYSIYYLIFTFFPSFVITLVRSKEYFQTFHYSVVFSALFEVIN